MRIAAAIVGLLILGTVPAATALAQRPDFTGHWIYNAAQSDKARDQLRGDSSGEGGSRDAFGGKKGGGVGDFGSRGWGGMNEETRERMRQTIRLAFDPPRALRITQADATITFVVDALDTLTLRTDGSKFKQKFEGFGDIEDRAQWQGNDLVVERSVSGGGKVVEDYLRSKDGTQLYVVVTFTGKRGRPIQFRRVYDPAPPG